MTPAVPQQLVQIVAKAAGDRRDLVDWAAVRAAGLAATGIPTPVTPALGDLQASGAPLDTAIGIGGRSRAIKAAPRVGTPTAPQEAVLQAGQ